MKYNKTEFNSAVSYYKKALAGKAGKGKLCLIVLKPFSEKAFFSLPPLSRALHEMRCDANVFVSGKKSITLPVLRRAWKLHEKMGLGEKSKAAAALKEFIGSVEKKAKSGYFSKIFAAPDLEITDTGKHFMVGNERIEFRAEWFRKRKWNALVRTAEKILVQGYGVKKSERLGIGFELIPAKKDLELPLDDYLDSFAIAYTFALKARALCKDVSLGSETARMSQLEPMDRVSDLSATLAGCEYEKNISEPWFRAFRKLSPFIGAGSLKPGQVSFGIHGKGYGGKHFFGMKIGYPTPDKKGRWQGPGQMFLKPWWLTQTKQDSRPPKKRHAITETLPIENYVATCDIDYFKLRRRDEKIRDVIKKCVNLSVRGRRLPQGATSLTLDLRHIRSGKAPVLTSDIEVNPKTAPEAGNIFGVNAGRYGNFPGGEVFLTPHKMDGLFVGDVVIAIDQSYVIGGKKPLVVSVKNGKYKIVSGPRTILNAFAKRKKEAWRMILEYEKSGAMPKSEIASYKRNFNNIGEFAVNTNPKARLSRYLIETEKLARMIHIALGSGYEPGRETTYHCDIVINSPRQRLDIFGVDENGKEHWIIKKGKMVV